VVSHLWAVTARCRVASPLYAAPAADVVSDPPLRSKPLYCGILGLVEGCYAPTRMCAWEDLSGVGLRWRDRHALRSCGELLAAREARLLSCIDALQLRLSEAELEVHDSTHPSHRGLSRKLHSMLGLLAAALCMVVARGWRSSHYEARAMSSVVEEDNDVASVGSGGCLEAFFWALLLVRVGHGWYSIMVQSVVAWEVAGRAAYVEVAAMRQQACMLQRQLAETQWMLSRLEVQLENLGVAVNRGRRNDALADGGRQSGPPGAMRVLILGWLASVCVLALLPSEW